MLTGQQDALSTLEHAILGATDGQSTSVGQHALKAVKALCKISDDNCSAAAGLLLARLKSDDAQVRLQALSVIDQLFSRSKVFRKAFLLHLDQFLELAAGIRASNPLPGPSSLRDKLREEALELIDLWSENWGGLFPQIQHARQYLEKGLKLKFPKLREHRAQIESAIQEAVEREREQVAVQFHQVQSEYERGVKEMEACHLQLEAAYSLLHAAVSDGEEDWEDAASPPDSQAVLPTTVRLFTRNIATAEDGGEGFGLPGYRTVDEKRGSGRAAPTSSGSAMKEAQGPNPAVLDALSDLYRSVLSHLPKLEEWLRIALKAEADMGRGPGRPSRDAVLAKAIQLRRQFREWKERLTNLNLPPSRIPAIPQSQGDPDDLFGSDSESDVEGANRPRAPASTISVRTRAAASGSEASGGSGAKAQRVQAALAAAPGGLGDPLKQDGASTTEFKDPAAYKERVVRAPRLSPTGRIGMATARSGSAGTGEGDRRPQPAAIPAHIKRQLAEQAPSVESGIHLLYWDSEMEGMLVNSRNMEVQNHWGPVDASAQLPADRIKQFFGQRASYYVPSGSKEGAEAGLPPPKPEACPGTLATASVSPKDAHVGRTPQGTVEPSVALPPSLPKRTSISAAHLLTARLLPPRQPSAASRRDSLPERAVRPRDPTHVGGQPLPLGLGQGGAVANDGALVGPFGEGLAGTRQAVGGHARTDGGGMGLGPDAVRGRSNKVSSGPSGVQVPTRARGSGMEGRSRAAGDAHTAGAQPAAAERSGAVVQVDPAGHKRNEAAGQGDLRHGAEGGVPGGSGRGEAWPAPHGEGPGRVELGGYGDGRTQGQRDRDYNRAVLAAAERGSVSTFELLQTDRQDGDAASNVEIRKRKHTNSVRDRLQKKLGIRKL